MQTPPWSTYCSRSSVPCGACYDDRTGRGLGGRQEHDCGSRTGSFTGKRRTSPACRRSRAGDFTPAEAARALACGEGLARATVCTGASRARVDRAWSSVGPSYSLAPSLLGPPLAAPGWLIVPVLPLLLAAKRSSRVWLG